MKILGEIMIIAGSPFFFAGWMYFIFSWTNQIAEQNLHRVEITILLFVMTGIGLVLLGALLRKSK